MAFRNANFRTSKRAYQILQQIAKNEEGSYSSEISRNANIDRTYVTEVLRTLLEKEVLKKGKRSQAQYYKVSFEGLYYEFLEICVALWEGLDKDSGKPQFAYDELGSEELDNELLYGFYRDYLEHYLRHNREGTIREMLLEDFYSGLDVAVELDDVPEGVKTLHNFLKSVIAGVSPSYTSVNYAINRYSNEG